LREEIRQLSLLSSGGASGVSAKLTLSTRIPLWKVGDFESHKLPPAGFLQLRQLDHDPTLPWAPTESRIRMPKAGEHPLDFSPPISSPGKNASSINLTDTVPDHKNLELILLGS